ncbi:amino acid--tRNA ligase-related protein [Mesomycoplasma ovipneumoniae]|uniref:amino acid--tRNA ligase-related protein n=1 Tax=Mesomycoplasma ovipneumoniae TaxID=29562 RepID=UPI00296566E1|nr:amino acid--tRNA ligase-related protein [Mesomycoplasma ovipneumoniae]MDW2923494.1 amino acid--tRNA ligase-related protein [Mesomycoplasma ovipneumoniae]
MLKYNSQDLNYFDINNTSRLKEWLKFRVIDITYKNALQLLKKQCPLGVETKDNNEIINSEGEKYLINKYKNKIIWLNNFPSIIVPFYQKSINKIAINSDLLIGIGEVVGSGERCENYNETLDSLLYHKNDPKKYEWYLEMKKNIPLKTSGFGIGLERLLLFIINKSDIRKVQLIPREVDLEILP